MINFGLVVLGAHTGEYLVNEINLFKNKKNLLVEPVPYNFKKLINNTKLFNNIICCNKAVSDTNKAIKFYFVKENSIKKLGKHWASGIGSFNKNHILDHKYKRFKIEDKDIESIEITSVTFNDLVKEYSILSIEKLQIDVEGSEYNIMSSINLDEIRIDKILFEYKHFDGTFKEGKKLNEIKKKLLSSGYILNKIDGENILAEKNFNNT